MRRLTALAISVIWVALASAASACGTDQVDITTDVPAMSETGALAESFGLARCEDLPELSATIDGTLPDRTNLDWTISETFASYAETHRDVDAGRFIDRDRQGTVVVLVTDSPDPHVKALRELLPGTSRFTTDTGVGDEIPLVWEVQQTRTSLRDMMNLTTRLMGLHPEVPLLHGGPDTRRNRVNLGLLDPTDEHFERLRQEVDPDLVCVSVTITPPMPEGPLQVIGDPSVPGSRQLPEGVNPVSLTLATQPDATSTELVFWVTERGCASGQQMGDRLLEPDVVETQDSVLVAFGVAVQFTDQVCPGNPSTEFKVTLQAPLGAREIRDAVTDTVVAQ